MLLLGGLPFSELIPQPASASVYHQTLFSWKQMEGNRETQQGTGCSTRSTTELFCLSTSTGIHMCRYRCSLCKPP